MLSSSFFDKFANTADEVKFRHYDSFQEISDNWRGFEAYRGLQTYDGYSSREQVMGAGLGALVDLGFSMQLTPTEAMRFIPIVHNGYTYLLVKTGVIGIVLFAIFVLQIGWLGLRMLRRTDPTRIFVGYLLLWTAIDFALTQGVITGIYNRSALAPNLILLGAARSQACGKGTCWRPKVNLMCLFLLSRLNVQLLRGCRMHSHEATPVEGSGNARGRA